MVKKKRINFYIDKEVYKNSLIFLLKNMDQKVLFYQKK